MITNHFDRMSDTTNGDTGWVATWASSTILGQEVFQTSAKTAYKGFDNETLRQLIFTSVGGSAVRLRISNRYGKKPLSVGGASIGVKHRSNADNSDIVPNSVRVVTFSGVSSVSIPAGQEVASDPVEFDVLPHQTLLVDLYLPEVTGPAEYSSHAGLTYFATGNHVGEEQGSAFEYRGSGGERTDSNWYYLTGVDVLNPKVKDVIVTAADSVSHAITVIDGNVKWSQLLSRRLRQAYGDDAPSVVQSTLSGQRLLTDSPWGPSTISRMDSEILSQPGATRVILLVGVNDFAFTNLPHTTQSGPAPDRSVKEMIDGYRTLVDKAHAKGVKIFGCTVPPADGHVYLGHSVWSDWSETKRQELNAWFRESGPSVFDGIFDFAAATENPLDGRYYEASCSHDGIHANNGGHVAFAQTVDIDRLME